MGDLTTFLLVIVVLLLVVAVSSSQSKRNKILCLFTGKDRTEEEKWINVKSGYVIFRGMKFDIITKRITSFWLTKGIHYLFPTRVNYLKYSWYSRFPHDPDNYSNVWETPEVRKAINKEEWVKSYAKGFAPPSTKKQSALAQYIPLITLVLVVLMGFYFYTNQQAIMQQMVALQNAFNAIAK